MNTFRRLSLAASVLFALAPLARAQTPYLETAPLSILWNFTNTGVSSNTTALTPLTAGAEDPDKLKPIDRITTEVGRLIVHTEDNGNQAFFVKHLLRRILEDAAYEARDLQISNANPNRLELLEDRIDYLKDELEGKWEITAVREPQATVAGAASTPYSLFLTRIDSTRRRPSRSFDTGMRIEPIYTAGNSTETLNNGVVTKATGTYTTHFRLVFDSWYASDPLYLVAPENRPDVTPGIDVDSLGKFWFAFGTGYMTYTIRSTPGPIAAVLPTRVKITGHGTWVNIVGTETGYALPYSGIGPFSIKMGEVKYQNRNMFPEFQPDNT